MQSFPLDPRLEGRRLYLMRHGKTYEPVLDSLVASPEEDPELPLTADGKGIRFRLRHRRADGAVEDLAKKESMVTGWQRPHELVVNLKRMLAQTSG